MNRPMEVYERPHCACTGELITWEPVIAERNGRKLRFASAECLKVFDEYLMPTYGPELLDTLDRSVFEPD